MAETRQDAARRRTRTPLRRAGVVGLAVTAPLALIVTLWPTHLLMPAKPRVVRGLEWLHERGLFEWLYWTRLEVLANVAMLVPIALLLTFILGARRWWATVAACVLASASIEIAQHFMPGRVASMRDIVANGLGALIGAVLAVGVEAAIARARRTPTP